MSCPIGYTCGEIDEAIYILNSLRKASEDIRDWGEGQEERADELNKENDELRERIGTLENQISDQIEAIKELKAEIETLKGNTNA